MKHVTLDGVRIHLRPQDRQLLINGIYTLHLNRTSTFIVESLIDSCYEVPKEQVPDRTIEKIVEKYKIDPKKAKEDFDTIIGVINSFARNEPPTHLIGSEIIPNDRFTTPKRMDLALTYECNNKCCHCYLSDNKNDGTLTTDQWKEILDKLWEIGVPEVAFTGGECTLRDDLPDLVKYGKEFITGIITNGTHLTPDLTKKLKENHLDWIQITLESDKPEIHDKIVGRTGAFMETMTGIKNAVDSGLSVSINVTLTKKNYKDLQQLIALMKTLGIRYISTNAIINAGRGVKEKQKNGLAERTLKKTLKDACGYTKSLGDIQLNWFLPTCYKNLNPIELGFGQRCCSACQINMMIQPDGSVIPCQSWTHEKLGNFLKDDWNSIWNHSTSLKLRNHGFIKSKDCKDCKDLNLCYGSCPLEVINHE